MEKQPKEEFYMIFVEGGTYPTTKHESKELAHKEAERLCTKTGRNTYVLKAVIKLEVKPAFDTIDLESTTYVS